MFSSCIAVVVGDVPYRSASLEGTLAAGGLPIVRCPAVTPNASNDSHQCDQDLCRVLYGRRLEGGEIGCVLVHREAIKAAISAGADWAIIFEDDAELVDLDVRQLCRDLSDFPFNGAAVVPLFSTTGIDKPLRHGRFRQLALTPTHTVAYAINRQAMHIAHSAPTSIVSSADWPPWSTKVRFFRWTQPYQVKHPHQTTIAGRRSSDRQSRVVRLAAAVRLYHNGSLADHFDRPRELFRWIATPYALRLLTRFGVAGSVPRSPTNRSRD
jgi:hypothetical protein